MKVLISSRSFGNVGANSEEMLKEAGLDIVKNTLGRKLSEEEIIEMIDDETAGIIAGTEKITRKVMESGSTIKVISRYGVGLDNVDLVAATELGIIVRNTPEAPTQAVSELAMAMIMNLLRKISALDRNIKADSWKPELGNLLHGKTVGIIGLGRIAKNLVKMLEPFDVKILALEIDPDNEFVKDHGIVIVTLKKLISESDIITLHIPYTEETKNIIGKTEFPMMKKNAILINTARGGLIDEQALVEALESEMISGAAVDAFDVEPYEGELKKFGNVILTPHIGTFTQETRKSMEIETVENLINGLKEMKII